MSLSSQAVSNEGASAGSRQHAINLFLVGFLVLFLELACIRWFAANVIFIQFFTNVVLLACFLGMSCGCLAARRTFDWLKYTPIVTLATIMAALGMLAIYQGWSGVAIDVGGQASPQEVFFGTENRNPDVAKFAVPIEAIVAFFFVLISFMFVGLGQVLGREFDMHPNRIQAYTLNIGGSLAGIAGFTILSELHSPPEVWFLICCSGIAYLLYQHGTLKDFQILSLLGVLLLITLSHIAGMSGGQTERWSPYYAIRYDDRHKSITVNTIGHQNMVPFDKAGSSYSLIHLLEKNSGGQAFKNMLVIGAGSGNDLDHALHQGVERVDAVEIDPVIQDIGIRHNIDHPYQDPRIVPHLDDGRHFLRTTDQKYDLVEYALVDSLVLHSGYSDLRLESYLFTQQAFQDVRKVLKPDGIFVTYNYFRQGWIVERVAAMAEDVFGCKPIVISLPFRDQVQSSSQAGFTMIIAGCGAERISKAFDQYGTFWLNQKPPLNLDVDGFTLDPARIPASQQADWQKIAPSTIVHQSGTPIFSTDDWPFLYVHARLIPDLSIRSMIILGGLGLGMVFLFLPRQRISINNRMFFLGAAFMLLETKAVVQLALLFGSTWLVNTMVFFTVLLLILLANLFVLKVKPAKLHGYYAALFAFLIAGAVVPYDEFLSGGILWRYAVPCVLAMGPMLFAGIIFARSFQTAENPDHAFGSNIAGSVLGGLSESFSMLLGFRHLLLLAALFYALSAITRGRKPA